MTLQERFNQSGLSRFLNSRAGRLFRLSAGAGFLTFGLLNRHEKRGITALTWSFFPLTAGAFDRCYISAALGGPFHGDRIRAMQGEAFMYIDW